VVMNIGREMVAPCIRAHWLVKDCLLLLLLGVTHICTG